MIRRPEGHINRQYIDDLNKKFAVKNLIKII